MMSKSALSEEGQETTRFEERFFGPPTRALVGSWLHCGLSFAVVCLIFGAKFGVWGEALYEFFFVEERMIDAETLAAGFILSATASFLRARMRGVNLRNGWLEYRDVINSVWPKVKRLRWAQVDEIHFFSDAIALELWDGSTQVLPDVRHFDALVQQLTQIAALRSITVKRAEMTGSSEKAATT